MRIRPMGAHALLIEVNQPAAWFGELERRRAAGELTATDIVPGARTVLIDGVDDPAALIERLRGWPEPSPLAPAAAAMVEVPVSYDGKDLPFVAQLWGTDEDGVIARLGQAELTVAFCGFTPGFAYLTGLPPEWAVPRLDTPRAWVPVGSVALADSYAGIYPTPSPGGWRLVGRTNLALFDPHRSPPALLCPGTRVRLVPRSHRAPAEATEESVAK